MTWRLFLPALLIVLAGLVGAWAISRRGGVRLPDPKPPGTSPAERELVDPTAPEPHLPFAILFAGELDGRLWLPPCSTTGQGDLLRIATAVQDVAGSTPFNLLISTGNIAGARGIAGAAEFDSAMSVLQESGLAVAAVGEKDLLMGFDAWRASKNSPGAEQVAIICSNLRDAKGKVLVPGWARVPAGRRRVLCVATLSPSFQERLREFGVPVGLEDPVESARAALTEAGEADFKVLLSHAPRAESIALAEELQEFDLVITAHGGELPSETPERVGKVMFVSAGAGWKHIGRAVFGAPQGKPRLLDYGVRPVSKSLSRSKVHSFHQERARAVFDTPGFMEGVLGDAAERVSDPRKVYVGASSCKACHPAAHDTWNTVEDPHFRSMDAVRERKFERVPQCFACHTTAPGFPGGHLAPGDEQARVSCESCHGPGGRHVATAGARALANPRESCVRCHTLEMSPAFDFEERWPKIFHGK